MYQGIEIIDFHAHFPTDRPWFTDMGDTLKNWQASVTPERAQLIRTMSEPYEEQWRRMWGYPKAESKEAHPGDHAQAQRWVDELDKYSIRVIAFVTGGGNEHLAEICSWHPDRFVGFAHHSPFLPDAVDRLEHAIKTLGLRGYTLLAPLIEEPIEDPAAFPVWEKCAKLGIPVLIHFGIQGGAGGIAWHQNINPFKLHNVAKSFPDVTFVIPHFGCAWERELIIASSRQYYTLPIGLKFFRGEAISHWELIMTGSSLSVIPLILVFLIFQRQIIKGVALTGLKG